MKPSEFIDENELYRKGIMLLFEKLGPVEASRFLSAVKSKRVESVKRHRKWQDGLDKDQFLNAILESK